MPPSDAMLVLASSSPQRAALLRSSGYRFRVVPPHPMAECGVCSRETPGELVVRLARQKGADVAEQLRREPSMGAGATHIVACDTVCQCGGQVLGKPADRQHAQRMLHMLSGRLHSVLSGLCVWPIGAARPRSGVAETTLRMDPLSPEQIEEYLDSGLWEGKAGAFGYQDRAGWLHVVAGSESNVIGLPLELLGEMLENREK